MLAGNSTAPALSTGESYYGIERQYWAWIIGGIFAAAAIIWSFVTLYKHWISSELPPHRNIRKHTLRILWMVPIYSLASWLGLILRDYALYWDLVRGCYESVTIYSFFALLVAFSGGKIKLMRRIASKAQQQHIAPCNCCLSLWLNGREFYENCRFGVLQYVVLRIVCAIATFVLQFFSLYCDGTFSYSCGYPYIAFVINASQLWALYCLVLFYVAIETDLATIRPLAKFMCVKFVVFMVFWQGLGFSGLVYINYIEATQSYTADDIATGLQNFAICIEMFFAAWAHHVYYPVGEVIDDANFHQDFVAMTEPVPEVNSFGLVTNKKTWRLFTNESV